MLAKLAKPKDGGIIIGIGIEQKDYKKMKRGFYKNLTLSEKENLIYDEMIFFVEKLEKKYGVGIKYNVDEVVE